MWYSAGTVAVTANSATVTGTGTAFSANARVGDAFRGPDGRWYAVTNIASASVISISPAYQGDTATGQTYAIAPIQGYVKDSADRLRQITDQFGTILADLGENGPVLKIDAIGLLADRAQYDSAAPFFAYYATDTELLYIKLTAVAGDWSAGAPVARGPRGEDGLPGPTGDVTPEASAARDAAVQAAADAASDRQLAQNAASASQSSAQDAADAAAAVAAIGAGWTPVLAVVADGERRVLQVADWTGGQSNKPTTGQYVGPSGLVSSIASAVNIRGAAGAGSVQTVAGVAPDANGNVALGPSNVGALAANGTAADASMLGGQPPSYYLGGGSWGSITGTLANQTDLKNALDAKVTGQAQQNTTDTTAGRLQLVGAFGWNGGNVTVLAAGTDANTVTTPGAYMFPNGGTSLHAATPYPYMLVFRHSNTSYIKQLAFNLLDNAFAIRTRNNGTWSAWDIQFGSQNVSTYMQSFLGVANSAAARTALELGSISTLDEAQACKAWVNFNGTTRVIRDAFNVSSITSLSTGKYRVNFTSEMPDTDYAVVPAHNIAGGSNNVVAIEGANKTKTYVDVSLQISNATFIDAPSVSVIIFAR